MLLLTAASFAAQQATVSSYHDPGELVRKAVQNEIAAANDDSAQFLFRGTKTTPKGSTTRLYVETKEATAGLVVAYNGKPLTPEQRQEEEARVERFIDNPEELRKKREQERENAERTMRIVRAMPDAFLFEYAGEETGSAGIGRAGDHSGQIEVPSESPLPSAVAHRRGPDRYGGLLAGGRYPLPHRLH